MEKIVNFSFTKFDDNPTDYLLEIYKDDVFIEDWAVDKQSGNDPLSIPLNLYTVGTANANPGTHTIKIKVAKYDFSEDESDQIANEFPSAKLEHVEVDGIIHNADDNIFGEAIKIYTLFTSDISDSIINGMIHSDQIGTYDLGLGDGSRSYSVSSPWNSGGYGVLDTVYVFSYMEPFVDWYNTQGDW